MTLLFTVYRNCCPGSYGEHSAQLLGDGPRVRCSSHRDVDWGVRRLEGRFENIDIKFRRSARLLLVWISFVTIQASASIPYWPQNDGSSLELGEFTITKRFKTNCNEITSTCFHSILISGSAQSLALTQRQHYNSLTVSLFLCHCPIRPSKKSKFFDNLSIFIFSQPI